MIAAVVFAVQALSASLAAGIVKLGILALFWACSAGWSLRSSGLMHGLQAGLSTM
jgi:hypothetical protein